MAALAEFLMGDAACMGLSARCTPSMVMQLPHDMSSMTLMIVANGSRLTMNRKTPRVNRL